MSSFMLALRPACGTHTTGAVPPPPALSDNTDGIDVLATDGQDELAMSPLADSLYHPPVGVLLVWMMTTKLVWRARS